MNKNEENKIRNAYVKLAAQNYNIPNVHIFDDASVGGTAKVWGSARISDLATVFGNAEVYGNARVSGAAWVYDNAQVYDHAQVGDTAYVIAIVVVYGNAVLEGDVAISSGWIRDVHWWKDVP